MAVRLSACTRLIEIREALNSTLDVWDQKGGSRFKARSRSHGAHSALSIDRIETMNINWKHNLIFDGNRPH